MDDDHSSRANSTPSYDPVLHANAHNSTDRVHKSGSMSNDTANGNGSSNPGGLNPRSCVTCRRRKVKCDKKHPCTNCTKARIDCIFPAPGRAPRKPRKPQDGELMERLRKLEGVVQSLGMGIGDDDESADDAEAPEETEEELLQKKLAEVRDLKMKRYKRLDEDQSQTGLESRFGRLVVDEGRSRYINPSFWANLSDEVGLSSTGVGPPLDHANSVAGRRYQGHPQRGVGRRLRELSIPRLYK